MTEQELKTPYKENHRVPRITVGARVRIEVEVWADSTWGDDATIDQVVRQGGREVLAKLEKAMSGVGRIVGQPNVQAVWTEERKS